MKLIFDFDHTLFSTKKLYSAFKEAFLKLGVEENLFWETFEKSKGRGRDYKPERQFKLIQKSRPEIKIGKLKKSFEKILKTAPRFLYNDVSAFLKKWSKEADLILLSYGEDNFQKLKIENSGIKKYFKKIIVTKDIDKTKPFKKLFSENKKIVFVEDNPQALLKTKASFPQIMTVRINRGEGKYCQKPNHRRIDFSIKNLKELNKILKRLKNNSKPYVIGVDGGGAKTVAALATLTGKILTKAKTGPSHPRNLGLKKSMDNLRLAIKKVLKKNKKILSTFLGLPAMEEEFKFKKDIIKKELLKHKEIWPIFKGKVIIGSDQLAGFRSGTDEREGVVLIAGSGCVAHGWRNKKEAKVCGWGYLSEMGSAFFIGQKVLQAVFKDLDGRMKPTLLTKLIFQKLKVKTKEDLINRVYSKKPMEILPSFSVLCDLAAQRGDKIAKNILIEAAKELTLSVKTVIKKLNFSKKKFPLVLIGSVLNSKIILDTVKKEIKKFAPKVQFIRPEQEPVVGAVKLAIEATK
jgi:N-acetylglucosamine kinase-like BadF-type ATPase/FMN phosphatase YigB (HAD superfamily)